MMINNYLIFISSIMMVIAIFFGLFYTKLIVSYYIAYVEKTL